MKILGFREDNEGNLRKGVIEVNCCKLRECISKNNCRNCTVKNANKQEKSFGYFECHTFYDSLC